MINYVAPLSALVVAYSIIGKQLWGSQAIGERTPGQEETIRSKRRVGLSCRNFVADTLFTRPTLRLRGIILSPAVCVCVCVCVCSVMSRCSI